jgi:uncharacterized membrane protein
MSLERKITGFLCGLSPWTLGLAPAYIAWSALTTLQWPPILCYVLAVSVELFGTMASSQALELRAYNKRKRQADPAAPAGAAWAVAGVYLGASALFCGMHAFPEIARYTLIIWAVMGGAAMGARAMRQDHLETLAQIAEGKAERKAEQVARKAEQQAQPVEQPVATVDNRTAILDILRNNGHATQAAIAQQVGITPQAVSKRLTRLEREGVIVDGNGDGWKVLA